MPWQDRDWAREQKITQSDDQRDDRYTITMTGTGYRVERDDDPGGTIGWIDVVIWIVILLAVGWGSSGS